MNATQGYVEEIEAVLARARADIASVCASDLGSITRAQAWHLESVSSAMAEAISESIESLPVVG